MIRFPGLLQLRLFNGLCPDFETIRGLVSELSSKLSYGLLWNLVLTISGVFMLLSKIDVWIVLWALHATIDKGYQVILACMIYTWC